MTGFPEPGGGAGESGGPDLPGAPEPLLHAPAGFLPAPPGAFERIRRRAAKRRRIRAAAGGTLAVAVLSGSVYLVGTVTRHDADPVLQPPVGTTVDTAAPTATAAPGPGPAPTGTGSGSPSARPSAPPPTVTHRPPRSTTSQPTTGGATPGSRPPVTPTAGVGAGDPPMCATSQLSASLGGGDAGAGNLYRYLVITNHSGTACHLTGYPGLSMLDAAGRQIGAPATREPVAYSPVVLRPGAAASDTVHTVNHQGACLPASARLRVYPPGNKDPLVVDGQITACDDTFSITPLTAGTTGNPPS